MIKIRVLVEGLIFMKASEFVSKRFVLAMELETKAKEAFTLTNKKGHTFLADAVWVKPNDYLAGLKENEFRYLDYLDRNKWGYYSAWNNVDHLAKTAEALCPGFMEFWKLLDKKYPWQMRVTKPQKNKGSPSSDYTPKDLDNFLRADLLSLFALLKLGLKNELEKWRAGFENAYCTYSTPHSSWCNDTEMS